MSFLYQGKNKYLQEQLQSKMFTCEHFALKMFISEHPSMAYDNIFLCQIK